MRDSFYRASMMCICDFAVAAESATFADGHINYGLHPGAGSSVLLGRMIGERRARWLLLSGEFIDAVEAERIGFVIALCRILS
jgi:enoyl-CoA hydratase/carnithine racemase